ncbi:MAG: hypothetical protein H0X65_05145 [Gemmatimonadetes bacterium]|nr:hypothetical protein [Gemmatimonadota bacterium]
MDLFVGNTQGTRLLTIQVKTAEWGERTRGIGPSKQLHHLDFQLGHKAARTNDAAIFFAFVDLRGRRPESVPDVYVVPSPVIYERCVSWAESAAMVRWNPLVAEAEPYKNTWSLLTDFLGVGPPPSEEPEGAV